MAKKRAIRQLKVRPAVRTKPLPADGNVYLEIVQDRVAARFGIDAVNACWSMGLTDKVMLHPAGPVHQALDRLDDLRLAKVRLSKTAERAVFLSFVKQWQQGFFGKEYETQERHRKVGQKVAAASRRQKKAIDDQRAATITAMYSQARKTLDVGQAGDIQARRIVARRWLAAHGDPITDRTIRNILDAKGVQRHRRPR